MRTIGLILVTLVISAGCSVNRIGRIRDYVPQNNIESGSLSDNLEKLNLTNESFLIQKAEIEINSEEGENKFLASIKFQNPDKYSISIRSKSGIEAARIFLTADTIIVNDRINRKQYCASPQYLKSKYGIATSFIPILLGDYIKGVSVTDTTKGCIDGKMNIDCVLNGMKINYIIDCAIAKPVLVNSENSLNENGITIHYSKFFVENNKVVPGNIEIRDSERKTIIKVKIEKMEAPWDGNIEFVSGNKYEIIQLK